MGKEKKKQTQNKQAPTGGNVQYLNRSELLLL